MQGQDAATTDTLHNMHAEGESPISPTSRPAEQRLHSIGGIGVATFLGSPLAGCALLALNYARLGMRRQMWLSLLAGIAATAGLLALAWAIPDSARRVNMSLIFLQLGAMTYIANALQGKLVKARMEEGTPPASMWKSAGIGLMGLIVVLGFVFGVVFLATGPSGTRLAIGSSEVYYSGSATQANAESFAADLKKIGFLSDDHSVTIGLSKDADGAVVMFVVNPEAIDSADTEAGFRAVGEELAAGSLGRPITIWLCDDSMIKKKRIRIE